MCHVSLSLSPSEHGPGIDIFTPGKPGEYDLEGGIWEDEDARNFYENLVDLKAFVPAILFKDNEKSGQGKDKDDAKGTLEAPQIEVRRERGSLGFDLTVSCCFRREGGEGLGQHQ